MKAIILAAGKSTRTYPLTINKPKALLPILDKTIIEHTLSLLKGTIDEIVIIVGFKKQMIIDTLGEEYDGMKITYIEQKEQLGTGHALNLAKDYIDEKFLMLCGDDIYDKNDIRRLLGYDNAALVKNVDNPSIFGVYKADKNKALGIIEKPKEDVGNLANIGCYIFSLEIFDYLENLKKTERGEIEVTCAINELCKKRDFMLETIKGTWIPITYPWNLLEANVHFLRQMKKSKIEGDVEEGATIKGNVFVGEGTKVMAGAYIQGPVYIGKNCEVYPGAYLRPDSILLDDCRIRSEVYDSLLMKGVSSKHNSYLGHSIIGENCNIGAGTITSDYRADGKNHITIVNGKKIDSTRRKLGAFLGDNVFTSIHTSLYPGRKIWPGVMTLPGEIVKKDKIE